MRYLVVWFIKDYVPEGMVIKTHALYGSIYARFPKECEKLGLTNSGPIEPTWKNQNALTPQNHDSSAGKTSVTALIKPVLGS